MGPDDPQLKVWDLAGTENKAVGSMVHYTVWKLGNSDAEPLGLLEKATGILNYPLNVPQMEGHQLNYSLDQTGIWGGNWSQ